MIRFSFVVPVYNAEEHLRECIQSLVNQKLPCEILLIDDGSTDRSGAICDEAAKQNDTIRVFHTQNQGPGAARNLGVCKAKGDYVVFVDSDDTVSDNLIEKASAYCEKSPCDLIFYPIIKLFPDGKCEPMGEGLIPQKINGQPMSAVREHLSTCAKFPASSGGKIVRRAFLNESGTAFHARRIGEDIDWTLQLITSARSAACLTDCAYRYRISPGSRRSFANEKSLSDQLSILEEWVSRKPDKATLSFLAFQYSVTHAFYGALPYNEKKAYRGRMKNLICLWQYGRTRKLRLIHACVSLFGLNFGSTLLYRFVRLRDEVRH